jgi:NAD+ synthase
VNFRGVRIGIPICEDIWGDLGVCETLAESGAEMLLVPNGSPYYRDKIDVRHQIVIKQVIETGLPILYANQLGGQDELVFDGASFAINADKSLAFQMSQFEESVIVTTWKWCARPTPRAGPASTGRCQCCRRGGGRLPRLHARPARLCEQERLQERRAGPFRRHRFGHLRGLAVDALGAERVRCVMMPYRYTSKDSLSDAEACAGRSAAATTSCRSSSRSRA